jgi:hypothetical protein
MLRGFESKWTDVLELPQFGAVEEHDIGSSGKRPRQRRPESAPCAGAPHDERAGRSDIHHLEAAQRVREEARAKASVTTDIHPSEKNNERHE